MADEKRDPEKPLPEDKDYDPDGYIRTAVTYGRLDLIKDWVPHQWHQPERITELVLFPAAMYGQLEVLDFALDYGESLWELETYRAVPTADADRCSNMHIHQRNVAFGLDLALAYLPPWNVGSVLCARCFPSALDN